ncbi:MAG: hypothetical protein K0R24_1380 [Gammaproteobacteria bacterium]|jgi:hypothetical protein|nr:hypothetical protein [Gammaproteobacteria bacterium]
MKTREKIKVDKTRGTIRLDKITDIHIWEATDDSIEDIINSCNWHARLEGVCYVIRWVKQDGKMEMAISCKWPYDYQSLLTKDWVNLKENDALWHLLESYKLDPTNSKIRSALFPDEIYNYLFHSYLGFFKEDDKVIDDLFERLDSSKREKIKNSLSDFEIAIFNHYVISQDNNLSEKLKNLKNVLLKNNRGDVNWNEVDTQLEDLQHLIDLKYPNSQLARAFYVFCGAVVGGVIGTQYLGAAAASVPLAPWMVGALAGSAIACVLLLAYHAYTYRSTSQLGMFKSALDKGLVFCNAVESARKFLPYNY